MRFCNKTLRTPDFRTRIFELETHHATLVSDTTTQLAVSVVRNGWKDLLFQSRWIHSIKPCVTPAMMVWSHFPLEALRWRKRLFFCQKRQSNRMRNSCIYLSIQDVNPHPTSLFSTCYPPSVLHILVLIRSQSPVEFALKCYLHGKWLTICLKTVTSINSWKFPFIGSYFQALLWLCDGETLYIYVLVREKAMIVL